MPDIIAPVFEVRIQFITGQSSLEIRSGQLFKDTPWRRACRPAFLGIDFKSLQVLWLHAFHNQTTGQTFFRQKALPFFQQSLTGEVDIVLIGHQ